MRVRAKLTLRNDKMLAAREALGLTQAAVAEVAEVPLMTVCELERMEYTSKDCGQRARRVADVLELDVVDVLPKGLEGQKIESTISRVADVDLLRLADYHCREPLLITQEVSDTDLHSVAKDRIEKILKTLTYREREIVKLRFGIGGMDACTYEECAHVFKVTRERVRQIEAKAIRKMQDGSRRDELVPIAATVLDVPRSSLELPRRPHGINRLAIVVASSGSIVSRVRNAVERLTGMLTLHSIGPTLRSGYMKTKRRRAAHLVKSEWKRTIWKIEKQARAINT